MILAAPDAKRGDEAARKVYLESLKRLEEFQTGDFYGILEAMDGLPVIIRLIDPPLHEFLPRHDQLLVEVTEARVRGIKSPEIAEKESLLVAVERLHEQNPMLGLRGCRLGILFPEIVEMQVRAIARAAARLKKEGKNPIPEIMIPGRHGRRDAPGARTARGRGQGHFRERGRVGDLHDRHHGRVAASLPGRQRAR